jgi:long-chain acyl-CoA synthetase
MMRESARRAPGHPAVIHGESRISDAELDALSDRVAASLTSAGLVPATASALQLPNVPQFVIAFFGILKASSSSRRCRCSTCSACRAS